ncbi:MAG: galactokinase [Ilumatobacteraceae bacterium]
MSTAQDRALALHRQRFRGSPTLVASAPGRVNLIGEHTDYNDGHVLPLALPMRTVITVEPTDGPVTLVSEVFGEASFDLATSAGTSSGWVRYVHGAVELARAEGYPVRPWCGVVATDVPVGASLSSSAALEIAALLAACPAGDAPPPALLARLGQRVENEVIGLGTGIMDQLVSAAAADGSALLIDCRSLDTRPVPLPEGVSVVVVDTGTRRQLETSAYDDRRADCAEAASTLRVSALRDASPDDWTKLDGRVAARARHVLGEQVRVAAAVAAMEAGDVVSLGRLMDESHASLRDDYEVSSPALDAMVLAARGLPGCLGARMTGGGFAGCIVALVADDAVADFSSALLVAYREPVDQPSTEPIAVMPVRPSRGAAIEPVG